jgi:hypothetical protein
MGRGLSQLQKDILAVIDASGQIVAGDLFVPLLLDKTPANRSAVSRALRRLVERKEIDALVTGVALSGRAYRYARHDPSRWHWPDGFVQGKLSRN